MPNYREKILLQSTEYYLSLYIYESAKFFAERLYYSFPTPQNLNILAQCYFRQGRINQTISVLENSSWNPNRYLRAVAYFALGNYVKAELSLLSKTGTLPRDLTQEEMNSIPGGPAGLHLLGLICLREQRIDCANEFFKYCLQVLRINVI